MAQPKAITEWGLDKRSLRKVREQLKNWLDLFYKQADYREGNIYRADFVNQDFFFFTDCRDILSKDPEGTGQEFNLEIRKRKRNVFNQLFIKTLLGLQIGKKIKCSHCGFDDVFISGFDGGHYTFCSKCGKTDICTYPNAYNNTIVNVVDDLVKKGYLSKREPFVPKV